MKKRNIIILTVICLLIFPPIIDLIWVRIQTPKIIETLLKSDTCVLNIDTISKERINILLTVEDPTFFENNGLDFTSAGAGFTTISQGIGKFMYFDNFKPGLRKLRLIFITRFALYPLVSKKEILTIFINYVYLGNYNGKEIRGFESASHIYYKKSFNKLTTDEFLSLVAMLINPNEYNIINNRAKNADRVTRIKKLIACNCKPINWKDDNLNGCK